MLSIQTNVNSLVAQQNLNVNNIFQSKTIQQLTSGYRINQSGDDAAGLAVANKFRSSTAELTQGVANGNDAAAQLQIMDGGINNISQILDRLKTLSTQSASGTFTGNRTTLNSEFQTDLQEIDRQAQSIGLNTSGLFAKSLDVYLGAGSGSSNLSNGIVTLNLTASTVDSQSLGLRGMEAVNLTSGSLAGTNVGSDIGPSSTNSVQNIVANTTGLHPNQETTTGYASFQFSGAGFSDAGKIGVSVNLAGVTDVATLATAVNAAIQTAGNGTTSAATAFKNANIVASVHTDSNGGQELAFSSSTAAFQVQAGDQMANALLGNFTANPAQGVAVAATAATTVTGANTIVGAGFSAAQTVKLVVTGGGLASPVTLAVNTTGPVLTSNAITDLETQFAANTALGAAGLSMSGSAATVGTTPLSFSSATGQAFNVQVTGDTANLLGLGSFLTDAGHNADYNTITGAVYSAAAAAGTASLEVSLNGAASTALTGINLSTGAHAAVASTLGSVVGTPAVIAFGVTNTVEITSSALAAFASTDVTATLTATHAATSGAVAGTKTAGTIGMPTLADTMAIKVDGAGAQTITFGTDTTAAQVLNDINGQLAGAHAFFDPSNGGLLTIASNNIGTTSGIQITAGTPADLTALGLATGANHIGTAASASLADIAGQLQTALGTNAAVTVVGGNQLQIASVNKGAAVNFTVAAAGTVGAGAGLGLTTGVASAGTSSSVQDIVDNLNAQFAAFGPASPLQAAGLQATVSGGNSVAIASTNGTQFRLNSLAGGNIGFGATGITFAGAAPSSSTTAMSTLNAYGVSNSAAVSFSALKYGDDKQAITFSATDNSGVLETQTISLQNNAATNRAGVGIDSAIAYINQQLQQSTTTPALQHIVAVKQNVSGAEEINFVSSLSGFTVGVAGTANADGLNAGLAAQVTSVANGSGANMAVDTQLGAEAAVTAVGTAVSKLGSAQAAVGKGENQLAYAISLAQSQITNLSAAESYIRDANVAQQAANLTKAQVLQQASIAAMAQANSAPQAVLALLRT